MPTTPGPLRSAAMIPVTAVPWSSGAVVVVGRHFGTPPAPPVEASKQCAVSMFLIGWGSPKSVSPVAYRDDQAVAVYSPQMHDTDRIRSLIWLVD